MINAPCPLCNVLNSVRTLTTNLHACTVCDARFDAEDVRAIKANWIALLAFLAELSGE